MNGDETIERGIDNAIAATLGVLAYVYATAHQILDLATIVGTFVFTLLAAIALIVLVHFVIGKVRKNLEKIKNGGIVYGFEEEK